MAEGLSGSGSLVMDNTDTSFEAELGSSVEPADGTAAPEEVRESLECSPVNPNEFLEMNEKITQKSLYTEIMEATRGSVEGSDSVLSEVARGINAIVGKVALSITDEEVETTVPKQCNLAAAGALEENVDRPTTSAGESSRDSMTETQLAARVARDGAAEAETAAVEGRRLVELLRRTIRLVEEKMVAAMERAQAAGGSDDEARVREAMFNHCYVSKCEAATEVLWRKIRRLQTSIASCEAAADVALQCAKKADAVVEEESATGRFCRFNACYRKSQTEAAIVLLYQKEYTALWTIKRLWEVDTSHDESDSSGRNEYSQQCENKERKTRVAHVAGFVVGVTLVGMSTLFKVPSDSFAAILSIGSAITLWTTGFWCNKLYEYIKSRRAGTTVTQDPAAQVPDFMEDVNRRLDRVERFLMKRNMIPSSDVEESDPGSSETLRAGDVVVDA